MEDWIKALLVVLAVLVGFPLIVLVFIVPVGVYGMMGYGMGGVGLLGVLFFLFPLSLVAAFVYLVVTLVRGGGDPALTELREAYARGELSTEEFEERRERLEK